MHSSSRRNLPISDLPAGFNDFLCRSALADVTACTDLQCSRRVDGFGMHAEHKNLRGLIHLNELTEQL
jgi:hypothetical protein